MQIVINISEEDYKALKQGHIPFNVLDVIMNGTPLPKGHGRLIDIDTVYDDFAQNDYDLEGTIEYAPTIIKADEEVRNENIRS